MRQIILPWCGLAMLCPPCGFVSALECESVLPTAGIVLVGFVLAFCWTLRRAVTGHHLAAAYLLGDVTVAVLMVAAGRIVGAEQVLEIDVPQSSILIGALWIPTALTSVSIGHARRRPRRPRPYCPRCGYSLIGNTTSVCSECGRTFHADEIGASIDELLAAAHDGTIH